MLIEAKDLINLPVGAEDAQSKVGLIQKIIINPENGQLLGFLVITGFFSPPKALSFMDVKFWDKEGLVTAEEDNLVLPTEIVRLNHVLKADINLIDMPAEDENGQSLGLVENFLIDTETGSVVKYYLRDILGNARILPSEKVIKIEKKIVFASDVTQVSGFRLEVEGSQIET